MLAIAVGVAPRPNPQCYGVLTLDEPYEGCSHGDKRSKSLRQFVVSRGDAAELLDAREEPFDQVTGPIEMLFQRALHEPVCATRDDRLSIERVQMFDQCIRVICLVGHHTIGLQIAQQGVIVLSVQNLMV